MAHAPGAPEMTARPGRPRPGIRPPRGLSSLRGANGDHAPSDGGAGPGDAARRGEAAGVRPPAPEPPAPEPPAPEPPAPEPPVPEPPVPKPPVLEAASLEPPARRPWRVSLRRSPLARRIVAYNLVALALLVAGVLHLDPFRDGLVIQRERALIVEAQLIAAAVEARLAPAPAGPAARPVADRAALATALRGVALPEGIEVQIFDATGARAAASSSRAAPRLAAPDLDAEAPGRPGGTAISDALDALRAALPSRPASPARREGLGRVAAMVPGALAGGVLTEVVKNPEGHPGAGPAFRVAVPVERGGRPGGALVVTSAGGVIEGLARADREAVLRLFALAIAVSIGLGLALASTIAGPLSELAHAAEAGRGGSAAKVRIPDLTARRDEIGRLSGALRGLVDALLERLDAEARFAADVAHEIKNPLASLGSAASALKAARPDQTERLMGVIEHDLRRLDRLVSDISNASRLDGELVREAEAPFDLTRLLAGLVEHLSLGAAERGVTLTAELPRRPIVVRGLEARLAQVFVNLIDNAVSFCEPGGSVRIRARRQGDRVLVSVEDTGPGIPEAALGRIFERFYSERPEGQFGDNSGLGLAISKQIVEAHGGVVWAENIRPGTARLQAVGAEASPAEAAEPEAAEPEGAGPEAARPEILRGADAPASPKPPDGDPGAPAPLGARLVVGLPA